MRKISHLNLCLNSDLITSSSVGYTDSFMLVLTSEHRLVLCACVCTCVFCSYSEYHTKTKTTQPGRRNTHLHPNPQRRHSCDSLNGVTSLFLSLSFLPFFLSSTMSDRLTTIICVPSAYCIQRRPCFQYERQLAVTV